MLLVVDVGTIDIRLLVIAGRMLERTLEVDKTEMVAVGVLEMTLETEVDKAWTSAVGVLETTLELGTAMPDVSAVEAGRTIALLTRLSVGTEDEVKLGSAESSSAAAAAFGQPPHDLWLQVREERDEVGSDRDTGAGVMTGVEDNEVGV